MTVSFQDWVSGIVAQEAGKVNHGYPDGEEEREPPITLMKTDDTDGRRRRMRAR
jgi:hypothetical protein